MNIGTDSNTMWYDLAFLESIMSASGVHIGRLLEPQDWQSLLASELRTRSSMSKEHHLKRSFSEISGVSVGIGDASQRADDSQVSDGVYGSVQDSIDGRSSSSSSHQHSDSRPYPAHSSCSVQSLGSTSASSAHSAMEVVWPKGSSSINESQLVLHTHGRDQFAGLTHIDKEHALKHMSHADLVAFALRQCNQIDKHEQQLDAARKKLKCEKQRLRRLQVAHNKMNDKLIALKTPEHDELDVWRGRVRKLSWRGSISLGLRKSMATASATTFPNAALLDLSRQTVTRCEIMVGAFLISKAVMFHRLIQALLQTLVSWNSDSGGREPSSHCAFTSVVPYTDDDNVEVPPSTPDHSSSTLAANLSGGNLFFCSGQVTSHEEAMCKDLGLPVPSEDGSAHALLSSVVGGSTASRKPFALGATFWSGDATNSSIWQKQKLQGLMTISAIMIDWQQLVVGEFGKAFKRMKCMLLDLHYSSICFLVCCGECNDLFGIVF